MMNKVSDKVIKNKSYEDDFQAIYEADHTTSPSMRPKPS
mgnify:CR=1 FL=1